jgi:glutamate carboxypeptidase
MAPLTISELENYLPDAISLLEKLVLHESPTTSKESVDKLGQFIAQVLHDGGAAVTQFPQTDKGDHWLGVWGESDGGILMLTHIDTVHPPGTLRQMPWRSDGERIYGPGVLDMKASIAMAVTALRALREASRMPAKRISLLCTSDEEMGSHTSREIIIDAAEAHDLVLCLEPALPDGSLKTWRKGTSDYEVRTLGTASHAGAAPELGVNAIHEMLSQLQSIVNLADPGQETTVNVGIISGGTRTNVIPDQCEAKIDVRTKTIAESDRISRHMDSLRPVLAGAEIIVSGGVNRPPMERTPLMIETYQKAVQIGARIGLDLSEGGTGGGSDANFVAPFGVPVLDGLGAIGEGAHSKIEYITKRSLLERTALLAALLSDWETLPQARPADH